MRVHVQDKRGFTMVELLVCVALMAVFSLVLTAGMSAATKMNHQITAAAETESLLSTIADALTLELRSATSVEIADLPYEGAPEGTPFAFDSPEYGRGCKLVLQDGQLFTQCQEKAWLPPFEYPLVPAVTYGIAGGQISSYDSITHKANATYLYGISQLHIVYDNSSGLFTITLKVSEKNAPAASAISAERTFSVQNLAAAFG